MKESVVNVKFCISELPNDMKMLAYLAGELSNSVKFSSTFANVSLENCKKTNGCFGKEKSDTWQSWQYSKRLAVVENNNKTQQNHHFHRTEAESSRVCALSWQAY